MGFFISKPAGLSNKKAAEKGKGSDSKADTKKNYGYDAKVSEREFSKLKSGLGHELSSSQKRTMDVAAHGFLKESGRNKGFQHHEIKPYMESLEKSKKFTKPELEKIEKRLNDKL